MISLKLDPLEFRSGRVLFRTYQVDWQPKELEKLLGDGRIAGDKWETELDEETAEQKLNHALGTYLATRLKDITGRRIWWVSSPPLIGHTAFGLIDRGTNIIQVRPICGCNLECIFCSVDEGRTTKTRKNDFVVDCAVLLEELRKLAEFKGNGVEAHIDGEGEPTLYHDLVRLVKGLKSIKQVSTISMQTNGTLLDDKKIKELEEAGLSRINLSVHTLDGEKAKKLCGAGYDLKHVIKVAETVSKSRIKLLIAPVWLPGVTDEDVPGLIKWADGLGAQIAVQNLLHNQFGRNLKKTAAFPKFYLKLKEWQEQTGVRLVFGLEELGIRKQKAIQKTMETGQTVSAEVILPGRLAGDSIAVANDRLIQVAGEFPVGKRLKLKILRDSQNIYFGVPA